MSVYDAEKAFKAAQAELRGLEHRALWNMNAGFLHLCSALRQIEAQVAELDRKIAHVSQQLG